MAHVITPEGAGIALLNYFSGFALTSNSGSPNTKIDVARGMCADSTNAVMISYAGGSIDFTKTGAGGLDTGSIGSSSTYNLFAIQGGSGGAAQSSVIASLAASPSFTNASGYSTYRRFASVLTDGSSHLLGLIQRGDYFELKASSLDANNVAPGTGGALYTLTVPTGIKVIARFRGVLTSTVAGDNALFLSPDENNVTSGATSGNVSLILPTANQFVSGHFDVITNTSAQIRASANGANAHLYITTYGWIDDRGRFG